MKEYRVVWSISMSGLEIAVDAYLNNDWMPVGGAFVCQEKWCQAMIRELDLVKSVPKEEVRCAVCNHVYGAARVRVKDNADTHVVDAAA